MVSGSCTLCRASDAHLYQIIIAKATLSRPQVVIDYSHAIELSEKDACEKCNNMFSFDALLVLAVCIRPLTDAKMAALNAQSDLASLQFRVF